MPPFDRLAFHAVALVLLVSAAPVLLFVEPAQAQIAVGISISVPIAPPVLPVYAQPAIPAPGYIWTPGYWTWNGMDYFWVPGTWVLPPRVGLLWTPGYWGWSNGAYVFNAGYWGRTVGFYGGINYGFGYGGAGFSGGYWNNGAFNYNTAVTNIGNTHIGNTYNAPVTINRTTNITNVSYNGGQGGVAAAPTAAERSFASQQHVAPTAAQVQHQQIASKNLALSYASNRARPARRRYNSPRDLQGGGDAGCDGDAPRPARKSQPGEWGGRKTCAGDSAHWSEWADPRTKRRAQRSSPRAARRRASAGGGPLSRFWASSGTAICSRASSGAAVRFGASSGTAICPRASSGATIRFGASPGTASRASSGASSRTP